MTLARAGAAREGGNRWTALAALYLAMFMNILDISVVNLALPVIRADLGASDTELEWVLVIYVLTFAAGLLPFGRFGDVLGRGRLFCLGVAGFTVSSLACGLAPDTTTLIASRGTQGLSAAMMVPQVLAIVHVVFAEEEKAGRSACSGPSARSGPWPGPWLAGCWSGRIFSASAGGRSS